MEYQSNFYQHCIDAGVRKVREESGYYAEVNDKIILGLQRVPISIIGTWLDQLLQTADMKHRLCGNMIINIG